MSIFIVKEKSVVKSKNRKTTELVKRYYLTKGDMLDAFMKMYEDCLIYHSEHEKVPYTSLEMNSMIEELLSYEERDGSNKTRLKVTLEQGNKTIYLRISVEQEE